MCLMDYRNIQHYWVLTKTAQYIKIPGVYSSREGWPYFILISLMVISYGTHNKGHYKRDTIKDKWIGFTYITEM